MLEPAGPRSAPSRGTLMRPLMHATPPASPDALEALMADGAQRVEWRVQKSAGYAFIALVLLACSGLFGEGPLAIAERRDGALVVTYERFARAGTSVPLRIRVDAAAGDRAEVELTGYDTRVEVERISPRPTLERQSGDARTLVFETRGGAPLEVAITVRFDGPGRRTGAVRVGGDSVDFASLVYP